MPRRKRMSTSGYVFHVLNRGAGRATIFHQPGDYEAFERILEEACNRFSMRLLTFCVMPNHWHLMVWPSFEGQLSPFMHWLTVTHTKRWHAAHGSTGLGPVYQGRFKAFPVQEDDHFLTVCRYVERNPLRAGLVSRAFDWRWCGLWHRRNASPAMPLASWPVSPFEDWNDWVYQPHTQAELDALRCSARRGTPFGEQEWQQATAARLDLETTLRPRGRPRSK